MTEQKNKLAEYQEKKDKILRMLEEIQIQIGDNELKDAIVQKQTKLKNDRFVVSVFGHFSNGKSTFLNALMGFGEEILTEDDAASTATITRLRYASEDEGICNKAEIEFSSGNNQKNDGMINSYDNLLEKINDVVARLTEDECKIIHEIRLAYKILERKNNTNN